MPRAIPTCMEKPNFDELESAALASALLDWARAEDTNVSDAAKTAAARQSTCHDERCCMRSARTGETCNGMTQGGERSDG